MEITNPVLLPDLCEIPWQSVGCWQRLDVFEDVAIGNTETANLNADIARDGDAAYDYILLAAKKQQEVSQIQQEMLEAERRDHFFDNIWHRGLILALAAVLAL